MNKEQENKSKSKKFAIGLICVVVLGAIFGFYKYKQSQKYEGTDDAQVSTAISPVIPHISGYIKEVLVKDNQLVKKGDTLLILDNSDYMIKLKDAQAVLETARVSEIASKAGISVSHANANASATNINTIVQQIEAAKINLWRASNDFKRYENLYQDHSITQQQFEEASANKQTAEKQLSILNAQKQALSQQTVAVASQTKVSVSQSEVSNTNIKRAQVGVDAANLTISYTIIRAAVDGQVSTVNLQPGQMVQAGQALFQIVQENEKWVVANFKETQLTKMKLGQKVKIKIDAYPNQEFQGILNSFAPGTGAAFSLLPPDNASGNFVKVIQRVPVKITFSKDELNKIQLLKAGMNADVEVVLE